MVAVALAVLTGTVDATAWQGLEFTGQTHRAGYRTVVHLDVDVNMASGA